MLEKRRVPQHCSQARVPREQRHGGRQRQGRRGGGAAAKQHQRRGGGRGEVGVRRLQLPVPLLVLVPLLVSGQGTGYLLLHVHGVKVGHCCQTLPHVRPGSSSELRKQVVECLLGGCRLARRQAQCRGVHLLPGGGKGVAQRPTAVEQRLGEPRP